MNYFELFDIPVSLKPDKGQLKNKFYDLSRKYHPDFFARATEAEQAEALETSSQINKAFQVLQDHDETVKYVLGLKKLMEEDEKYRLSPGFLMEVMELNELLMEAKMSEDPEVAEQLQKTIAEIQSEIYEPVKHIIENFKEGIVTKEELLQVKEYYFRRKYLNRILAGLN